MTDPNPQADEVLDLLDQGLTQTEVGLRLGLTKNAVAGIWARHGDPLPRESTTIYERCDALNQRLDAVLAETRGIGRVPNAPKMKVVR
jgi:hypothetical protein